MQAHCGPTTRGDCDAGYLHPRLAFHVLCLWPLVQRCPAGKHGIPRAACLPVFPTSQPQLFIPHSAVASIELMRAGGTSSTFDLVVHLKGGHAQEFGMLSRSEVAGIEGEGLVPWGALPAGPARLACWRGKRCWESYLGEQVSLGI